MPFEAIDNLHDVTRRNARVLEIRLAVDDDDGEAARWPCLGRWLGFHGGRGMVLGRRYSAPRRLERSRIASSPPHHASMLANDRIEMQVTRCGNEKRREAG